MCVSVCLCEFTLRDHIRSGVRSERCVVVDVVVVVDRNESEVQLSDNDTFRRVWFAGDQQKVESALDVSNGIVRY